MLHVSFLGSTYTPEDEVIPGNSTAQVPVRFHLEPPGGPDLARIKSVVYAIGGLVNPNDWTPEVQESVLKAFETGRPAFENTVRAVEGLTVPALAALRFGLIPAEKMPQTVVDGVPRVDEQAPIQVPNGWAFGRVCVLPDLLPLSMIVALKIAELAEKKVDPRFFAAASGSGGTATPEATDTTARGASHTSGARGTAAKRKRGGAERRGSFRSKP